MLWSSPLLACMWVGPHHLYQGSWVVQDDISVGRATWQATTKGFKDPSYDREDHRVKQLGENKQYISIYRAGRGLSLFIFYYYLEFHFKASTCKDCGLFMSECQNNTINLIHFIYLPLATMSVSCTIPPKSFKCTLNTLVK